LRSAEIFTSNWACKVLHGLLLFSCSIALLTTHLKAGLLALDVSVMARMYVSILTTGTGSVDSTPVITFEGERGHMKCIYLETELTFGLWPSFTLSRNSRQWCQGLDVEGRQLLGIAVVILQL